MKRTARQAKLSPKNSPSHSAKKPRTANIWVSGTEVRNYMIKDPLVDWLKLYRPEDKEEKKAIFFDLITQKGKDFEKEVIQHINDEKFPVVSISDEITDQSCLETIRHIKKGTPIIHSAPFQNSKDNTRGIIDLLVRSDKLHLIVENNPLPENLWYVGGKIGSSPRAGTSPRTGTSPRYHYVVIDIKFSTLPFRANGTTLLNSGSYPAYKAQLCIYNIALGHIQGYTPRYSYILGRRWNYTCKGEYFSSLEPFSKLGVIDFQGVDEEYIGKTNRAVQWIRDVRENGMNWSIDPPSREELYPNMCVDSGPWNTAKKDIANKIGEISQVWYCGITQRNIAREKGILSWRDKNCTAKNMGISSLRGDVIDSILKINRQDKDKILPKKISTNILDWRNTGNEIFVDFETFCDICPDDDIMDQNKTDRIFMIGVWYCETSQRLDEPKSESPFSYKCFLAESNTDEEEYRIMDEFTRFVHQRDNPKIWYWHAEKSIFTRQENRQMDLACHRGDPHTADHIVDDWKIHTWADLAQLFRSEPIVIKDVFKFGLKEVAHGMHKHGFIHSKIDSQCNNGLDASILAWKAYTEANAEAEAQADAEAQAEAETQAEANTDQSFSIISHPVIQDIALYNKFDVEVLHEILTFLRKNL